MGRGLTFDVVERIHQEYRKKRRSFRKIKLKLRKVHLRFVQPKPCPDPVVSMLDWKPNVIVDPPVPPVPAILGSPTTIHFNSIITPTQDVIHLKFPIPTLKMSLDVPVVVGLVE